MEKDALQQLEQQVDELLGASRRIREENMLLKSQHIDELLRISRRSREENMLLRSQQSAWLVERAQLIEKTDLARNRLEKMMSRLKELDDEL